MTRAEWSLVDQLSSKHGLRSRSEFLRFATAVVWMGLCDTDEFDGVAAGVRDETDCREVHRGPGSRCKTNPFFRVDPWRFST